MSTRTDIFDDADFDTEAPAIEETTPETNADTAETQEAPVAETSTTTKAELTDEQKAAKEAEHEAALKVFTDAVEAAVDNADETTGTVDEAALQAVSEAYRGLSGGIKYKNLAKSYVDEAIKSSIPTKQYIRATSYNEVSEKLRTVKSETKPKVTVDPRIAYGERIAALELAKELLEEDAPEEVEGYEVPSVEVAYRELVEYRNWTKQDADSRGEAPELGSIATAANKLIEGKAVGKARTRSGGVRPAFTGVRRNVAVHIENAFEGIESGKFLTVSEIVNTRSEEYGDDAPSSGAVSARLFPGGDAEKCTVAGITPGVNANGTKGATKN